MGYGEIRLQEVDPRRLPNGRLEPPKYVIARDFAGYYWSPKFDGWNVTWDGRGKLYSKSGKLTLPAPHSFMDQLPRGVPVAGELIVRGQHATKVAELRKAGAKSWEDAKFYAFDLPANLADPFSTRTETQSKSCHRAQAEGKVYSGTFRSPGSKPGKPLGSGHRGSQGTANCRSTRTLRS